MEIVKKVALAVFNSPKVRLALKALALAAAGVVASELGWVGIIN